MDLKDFQIMNNKRFRDENEVLADINQLVSSENYIEAIAQIIIRDFSGSAEKITQSNVQDIISYNEFAFLIGLWLKNQKSINSPNDPSILVRQTDDLLKEYHQSMFFNNSPPGSLVDDPYEYLQNSALMKEAVFYSATAGYDSQYVSLLTKKYVYDTDWLKDKKQINLADLPLFFASITKLINGRLQTLHNRTTPVTFQEKVNSCTFTKDQLINGNPTYEAILNAFALPLSENYNPNLNDIADFNDFIEKPIITLKNNKYYIPVPYYLAEAMYESPFYWMFKDESYRAEAAKNRGNAAEDLVYSYALKFFGRENVQRNINIKINDAKRLTDIDIIAYTKDTTIVFQIKSKKLTLLSRKGNLKSIKSDFTKAVREATHQADLSIQALKNSELYEFEPSDGSSFVIKQHEKYEKVIVLLDQYPAISHQTHILFGNELDHTPIAFSIFDLETLFEYLKSPDQFADYINRRTKYGKQYRSANELQYLGYYLDHGMKKLDDNQYVYIDPSYGQLMDSKQHQKSIDQFKKETSKIGRNDHCPCGSGKKFKKCHG
jgi:hypothetical protein